MLSGVGDERELKELNIPTVKSLPHVGLHLQDHYGFSVVTHTKLACPKDAHRDENGLPEGGTHLGYLNDFLGQLYAFYKVENLKFEMFMIEGCVDEKYTLTFTLLLVSPSNQGRILLKSGDPMQGATMEIHPKAHDEDLNYLLSGLQRLYARVFPGLRDEFSLSVNPPTEIVADPEKGREWIRENLYFYSHPTGTARLDMNNMEESVLNHDLTVQGISNLRVCDASVFGKVVVGHTDGPTRMVGANCARMIFAKEKGNMPVSGYGTNNEIKPFHVQYYLNAGGRLIDTAAAYEKEKQITQGWGQSDVAREDMFLVTKISPEDFDDTYGAVMRHLEKFQATTKHGKEVQIDYLDMVLLHWPHLYDPANQKSPECASKPRGWVYCRELAWQGLEKLVKAKKVRFLGVSNFAVRHIEKLYNWSERKVPIYANQIEYHPFVTPVWEETKVWCQEHGIRVMAFGALGGLKREMLNKHPKLVGASESEDVKEAFSTVGVEATVENLMFQWGLNQGVTVVQGSRRKRHMDQFMKLKPGLMGSGAELIGGEIEEEWRDKVYQPDSTECCGEGAQQDAEKLEL